MRWWNEQSEDSRTGSSTGGLSEVSGVGTADGDSEGDAMVPKRRRHPPRDTSEGQSGGIQAEAPLSHFINGRCQICKHPKAVHFIDTDSIGTWSFCSLSTCECFVDEKGEDDSSTPSNV